MNEDERDQLTRPGMCDGKVGHSSRRVARRAARRTGEGLVAYRCPRCWKWHIGHRADKIGRQRAAMKRRG